MSSLEWLPSATTSMGQHQGFFKTCSVNVDLPDGLTTPDEQDSIVTDDKSIRIILIAQVGSEVRFIGS